MWNRYGPSVVSWQCAESSLVSVEQQEWALLQMFPRSEVKGQGYSGTKCDYAAKAYISTVWRRDSLCFIFLLETIMVTVAVTTALKFYSVPPTVSATARSIVSERYMLS